MKNIKVFICALAALVAYSCNFTEEIHFEEDGSGKMSINFDGSELMQMAGDEMSKTNEKPVDSIISFKELLEEKHDSIAELTPEEQAKLKRLEHFNLHMVMNPEEKVMKFDLFSEFKDVSQVNDAFNTFKEAGMMNAGKAQQQPAPMAGSDQATEVNYTFNGNTFSRKATIIDEELFQQSLDSLTGAEMFLSGSTYTIKYHFPKKVKSTNLEEATFSADGKTLIYEMSFLDLMKDPTALDLQVELEK